MSSLPALAFCQGLCPAESFACGEKEIHGAGDAVAWSRGGWRGIRDVRKQDCAGREPGSGEGVEGGHESLRQSKLRTDCQVWMLVLRTCWREARRYVAFQGL